MGALAYAGDLTLVSPLVPELQRMLDICVAYTESHSLILNIKKSAAVEFVGNKYTRIRDPNWMGQLKYAILHLGAVLNQCGCDD